MSVVDDPKTFGRARLSFASVADIDEFVATLERYERGELTPDQWRAFRLVRGTYGQRQTADAQMLRVKIPQGILTSDQLASDAVEIQGCGAGTIVIGDVVTVGLRSVDAGSAHRDDRRAAL